VSILYLFLSVCLDLSAFRVAHSTQLTGEDLGTFRSILDMKGIKKADQGPYVDLFKGLAPTPDAATVSTETTTEKQPGKGAGNTAVAALAGAARATTAVTRGITSGIQKAKVDKILKRFKDKKDDSSAAPSK
jgi:hypothetical protein